MWSGFKARPEWGLVMRGKVLCSELRYLIGGMHERRGVWSISVGVVRVLMGRMGRVV
jgi:hypothetical protein